MMERSTSLGCKGGIEEGVYELSGVMDNIRNKMLLSVFVLFGTLVTAGGRV